MGKTTQRTARSSAYRDDTHWKGVVWTGLGLGLGLTAVFVVSWLLLDAFKRGPGAPRSGRPSEIAQSPVTAWVDPGGDLAAQRAYDDERLQNYGWVDREVGIARIPIEEAMRLMAIDPKYAAWETGAAAE